MSTTTLALFGAGGKMGARLARNLQGARDRYRVRHVEPGAAGRDRLQRELGIDCVEERAALDGAQVVILAVPDTLIGRVAAQIEPHLAPGTMVITLDAAAPFAGHLPSRPDLVYFVTHPCHPSIFSPEVHTTPDYFGGVAARQSIVSALMQGPAEAFDLGEDIAKVIYQPVERAHRVAVEQMALLEPGLSETVCATLLDTMREAMDEVVARGVPEAAARLPARPHDHPVGGDLQANPRPVLRRLQQGHRPRQAAPVAQRLEAGVRARRDRREHPSHHLSMAP